ncbi:MAG TPA: DNA polymerase ligase N-terminal domain-containing protein [Candidatus Paceibacterota bacterium]|nr:DNA polymerase ligase N-terminal domain-containing protein [Candidatus Paceibacterota bacterium]
MQSFVIQEHHASHLHWDFRLEMLGVLKSWAITKIPPLKKGIKRLAIQVEDHELSYGNFEGEIKEGYGKGTVKIWDKGTYKLIEKTPKKIEFELKGKKLTGKYILIALGNPIVSRETDYGKNKNRWLFFKI